MAAALPSLPALENLFADGNPDLGAEGVAALAEALRQRPGASGATVTPCPRLEEITLDMVNDLLIEVVEERNESGTPDVPYLELTVDVW